MKYILTILMGVVLVCILMFLEQIAIALIPKETATWKTIFLIGCTVGGITNAIIADYLIPKNTN